MLNQKKNGSSWSTLKIAALLASSATVVNAAAINVVVGYTKQWIYIAKDTARAPDLHNPAADYCPDVSSLNGSFLPTPAQYCLTNSKDGGKYAFYDKKRIDPTDTAGVGSEQESYCGNVTCVGTPSTNINITEQECVDYLESNAGFYSATYIYETED